MTGRRLYDHFTDAAALRATASWQPHSYSQLPGNHETELRPHAWAFLTHRDRAVWNETARRLTPTRKAAKR